MMTDGKYKARAVGQVVLGTSKQKNTPFIETYFEVLDGEHAGEKARWTGYFTEKTQARTIEALQIAGWQGDDVGEFADGALHGLDANEVEIVVESESYVDQATGEERHTPRVQWVNRLGGYLNVQNAMSKDAAASFGEKMKGLVLKMRAKAPAPSEASEFPFGANEPKSTGTSGRKF